MPTCDVDAERHQIETIFEACSKARLTCQECADNGTATSMSLLKIFAANTFKKDTCSFT
jgi:hypothetical protein